MPRLRGVTRCLRASPRSKEPTVGGRIAAAIRPLRGIPALREPCINPRPLPRVTPHVPANLGRGALCAPPPCRAARATGDRLPANGMTGGMLAASSSSGGTSPAVQTLAAGAPIRGGRSTSATRRNTNNEVTRRKREHFELRTKVGRIRIRDRCRIRGRVRCAGVAPQRRIDPRPCRTAPPSPVRHGYVPEDRERRHALRSARLAQRWLLVQFEIEYYWFGVGVVHALGSVG